jgi:hypothetical protein
MQQYIYFFDEHNRYDVGGGTGKRGYQTEERYTRNEQGYDLPYNLELEMLEGWREQENQRKIEEVNRHFFNLIQETREPTEEELYERMRIAKEKDISREKRLGRAQLNVFAIFKKYYATEQNTKGAITATISALITPFFGIKNIAEAEIKALKLSLFDGQWEKKRNNLLTLTRKRRAELLEDRYVVT